jgi:hypothetical protein
MLNKSLRLLMASTLFSSILLKSLLPFRPHLQTKSLRTRLQLAEKLVDHLGNSLVACLLNTNQ